MIKNIIILSVSALVIALPFIFRQEELQTRWKPGDPELVIVTPHNEAIRFEFGHAFSKWHEQHYGKPVRIDWRAIGGTSEIMRYLAAAYVSSYRSWWKNQGKEWPLEATQAVVNRKYKPDGSIVDEIHRTMREIDDAEKFGCDIDLFFGGGEYDHNKASRQGMSVPPWPVDSPPEGILSDGGLEVIPERLSGETWRTATLLGTAISTFGICYNMDRLAELGVDEPEVWDDLANPKLFKQIGVSDPTKSGSISKAFEMIVHQKVYQSVIAAGFGDEDIAAFEKQFEGRAWEVPEGVPARYQEAIEAGWLNGIHLIQKIGANARYFTDSSTKVPIDVSMGDAAAGLAIDFYGRYQAETSKAPDGTERMRYITPDGGSSVSCDPASLLRGAPNKEIAIRYLQFVLSENGQRIWNYRPGSEGGPLKFALRRLPIRRSFYPSTEKKLQAAFDKHKDQCTDDLGDPAVNPYELARKFTYYRRWTGNHFSIHRNLIKAMCLDSGEELKEAWMAINANGGPDKQSVAMKTLQTLPEDFTWKTAIDDYRGKNELKFMRDWVIHFREVYGRAKAIAEGGSA